MTGEKKESVVDVKKRRKKSSIRETPQDNAKLVRICRKKHLVRRMLLLVCVFFYTASNDAYPHLQTIFLQIHTQGHRPALDRPWSRSDRLLQLRAHGRDVEGLLRAGLPVQAGVRHAEADFDVHLDGRCARQRLARGASRRGCGAAIRGRRRRCAAGEASNAGA